MNRQRGNLNLVWFAVLIGLISFAVMAGLLALRDQRNLFAETWNSLVRSSTAKTQQIQSAANGTLKSDATTIRKCMVDGKVVFSNVECGADNPTSQSVQLHDSRGIEPPKVAPAADGETPADQKWKIIERTIPR